MTRFPVNDTSTGVMTFNRQTTSDAALNFPLNVRSTMRADEHTRVYTYLQINVCMYKCTFINAIPRNAHENQPKSEKKIVCRSLLVDVRSAICVQRRQWQEQR